jgi:hypothetical protein
MLHLPSREVVTPKMASLTLHKNLVKLKQGSFEGALQA